MKTYKNLDKIRTKESVKTVEEWLTNNDNSDLDLVYHCLLYNIKEKNKKDIYKYFEICRNIIDKGFEKLESNNKVINKIEDFEKLKNTYRQEKIYYRIYDQKKILWIEPTYTQKEKKKKAGFFSKLKQAFNAMFEIMSSDDSLEYTTIDEARELQKYYMEVRSKTNSFADKQLDKISHDIYVMSKIESNKLENIKTKKLKELKEIKKIEA